MADNYGPPEWDWSNKRYVQRQLAQQNKSRRKKAVYFSDWKTFGQHIRASKNVRRVLWREAERVLSDLRSEMRQSDSEVKGARENSRSLYVKYVKRTGHYNDRPFAEIWERTIGASPSDPGFAFYNFRSAHSESQWENYQEAYGKWRSKQGLSGAEGEGFEATAFMDKEGFRDRVVNRYLQRNKTTAYGYDPSRNHGSVRNPYPKS